jgi:hypothetical protein
MQLRVSKLHMTQEADDWKQVWRQVEEHVRRQVGRQVGHRN